MSSLPTYRLTPRAPPLFSVSSICRLLNLLLPPVTPPQGDVKNRPGEECNRWQRVITVPLETCVPVFDVDVNNNSSAHQWPWMSEKMLQILISADKAQGWGEEVVLWIFLIQQITFSSILGVCTLLTHQATLTIWNLSSNFTAWLTIQCCHNLQLRNNCSFHLELLDINYIYCQNMGSYNSHIFNLSTPLCLSDINNYFLISS